VGVALLARAQEHDDGEAVPERKPRGRRELGLRPALHVRCLLRHLPDRARDAGQRDRGRRSAESDSAARGSP
jgi:hypothetical protein